MDRDPNFPGYRAKSFQQSSKYRKVLSQLKRDVRSALLFPYGVYKHRRLLATCDRVDNHTYTCFYRAPTQFSVLAGPVLDFLGRPQDSGRRLEILMFACSNGAEAYTTASWLMQQVPSLNFHIEASDLHDEMVRRCVAGDYSADEALQSEYITPEFVNATFERRGDRYVVHPHIREKVHFRQANLLDAKGLHDAFGPADIVTAQNVLFHMTPTAARAAFANAASFLKPKGALLVEGMDSELRIELTREHGLVPLTTGLKGIYSETRVHTPQDWWNYYWGTEPYFPLRSDKERRYGTIFLRDAK